jgi:glycosyltransferase involved in cell wall biosynthesis
MRVLMLAPHPFFVQRGTPIADRAAAEALRDLGHQVDLLTYHVGQDVVMPGINVFRIAPPPLVGSVPIGPSWQKLPCDRAMFHLAEKLHQLHHYDVLHGVEEAAFIAWRIKRRLGVPYVVDMDSLMSAQIQEKWPWALPAAKVFQALEARSFAASEGVLAVCPKLAQIVTERRWHDHVAVLPDLPNDQPCDPADVPLALRGAKHGLVFLYVGNLERYQGVDLMLQGFAAATTAGMPGVLVIVGGDERHIRDLSHKHQTLVAGGRVIFAGTWPAEKLSAVLARGDVLVSPRTRGLNTPMKIYSYLAAGKPVLATDLPTHTQVLDAGTAVLVQPTPAALAQGMRQLADDADLRQRLGLAGRRLIAQRYNRDAYLRTLREFYERVAQRIGQGPPRQSRPSGRAA